MALLLNSFMGMLGIALISHILIYYRAKGSFSHIHRSSIIPIPRFFMFTPYEIISEAMSSKSKISVVLSAIYVLSLILMIVFFIALILRPF